MNRLWQLFRYATKFGAIVKIGMAALALLILGSLMYGACRIAVPEEHFAVLVKVTGKPLTNGEEVAQSPDQQGIQLQILGEGRYFYNPLDWDWRVYPMIQIPNDKMGVRIRLHGEDLPYGEFLAKSDKHKGVVPEVLNPGRYAINAMVIDKESKKEIGQANRSVRKDYVELIELWDPKVIPAGYEGVVTNLTGPLAKNANVLTVSTGERGTQKSTLQPGTYYRNPYIERINSIETRSLRFNLSEGEDMSFPSKDGFPVSIDGIVELRVDPARAPETYVMYNEMDNDSHHSANIQREIIEKVIMPNARSYCRLRGSDSSAREFIGGETRVAFQHGFQKSLTEECGEQGIIVEQALITKIRGPEAIAEPLRKRELAVQTRKQFTQQVLQQQQEALLETEKRKIPQKTKLIEADRDVVAKVTAAEQAQEVALAKANQEKEVAEKKFAAASDEAIAIKLSAEAEAAVVGFENEALAAGWREAVKAMGNEGDAYADFTLFQKLAPSFKKIMSNTGDSPLMKLFEHYGESKKTLPPATADADSTK